MRFEWDEDKSFRNLRKHKVGFETAILVFEDPHALTQRDEWSEDEDRWITLGSALPGTVLYVVHTDRKPTGIETIRIISARNATPREKRQYYEEAQQESKERYRRSRSHER